MLKKLLNQFRPPFFQPLEWWWWEYFYCEIALWIKHDIGPCPDCHRFYFIGNHNDCIPF